MKSKNVYLVYLRWPESCFRANPLDIAYLKTLVPAGAEVIEAKTERGFLRALPKATHVITWYFFKEWYKLAPKLKVVATPSAGRELIAPDDNVKAHFGHYHGDFIAESVAAFCLAFARGFLLQQPTEWPRTWMGDKCIDLVGSKAVILGYGHVGRAIGQKLAALGVQVSGYSRHNPLPVGKIDADWFIMVLPSDTGTDNVLNSKFIARLPRRCVVVNVGRGNAVDEKALEMALRNGRLKGAYLDVLKHEPHCNRAGGFTNISKNNSQAFISGNVPNCWIMPHSSAFSPKYLRTCFKELKDDGVI